MPESKPTDPHTDPHYAWEEQVLPYVQDELSPEERKAFECTLEESSLCKLRVYETRCFIEQLNAVPDEQVSSNLQTRITEAIAKEHHDETRTSRILSFPGSTMMKAAACLAVLVSGILLTMYILPKQEHLATTVPGQQHPAHDEALTKGLNWLVQTQEASGAWDGSKWGGGEQHKTGLTGLAILALSRGRDGEVGEAYDQAIRKGVSFLQKAQNSSGQIHGDVHGTTYDHAIATYALLEAYQHRPTAELKEVLDRAIPHLRAPEPASSRDFAYGPGREEPKTSPTSAWSLMALQRAGTLGWTDTAITDQSDLHMFYRNLLQDANAAQKMTDLHQVYLMSTGLASRGGTDAGQILEALQTEIASKQDAHGPLAGSWDLSDSFSLAGGRVYTTSMATLTLGINTSSARM